MAIWHQVYDPLNNKFLSTAVAALPIVLLLGMIASNKVKTYWAAAIALVLTILVAVYVFTMPAEMALKSAGLGAVDGFCKIGWIILNVLFLYRLTVEKGLFAVFQHSLGRITAGVAHEVKNPLNSMRLWLENLKESLPPEMDSNAQQAVQVLDKEIDRLDRWEPEGGEEARVVEQGDACDAGGRGGEHDQGKGLVDSALIAAVRRGSGLPVRAGWEHPIHPG